MKILVADERAELYRPLLQHVSQDIEYTSSIPDSTDWEILLASPGLARQMLNQGCRPKWIQSTWAGVDDLLPAIRSTINSNKIVLTGIKGIFGQLMSEYVFAYVLADLRELQHYRQLQTNQNWDDSHLPETLASRTIAIIGTGSIGQHLAQTARHFGMKTVGVNRSGSAVSAFDQITVAPIEAIAEAHYVVSCLPDTQHTAKIFDADFFDAMLDTGMFINVGRGNSVDEAALVRALEAQQIRSAVLDVFVDEPLSPTNPLWGAKNLTITPHISAPSFPKDIAAIFLENLRRYERGEALEYQIDPDLGY